MDSFDSTQQADAVEVYLNNADVTLYVTDAAYSEVAAKDKFGTQVDRIFRTGGANIVRISDGDLSGIDTEAAAGRKFGLNDMRSVQAARERRLPVLTTNYALARQITSGGIRQEIWGMVYVIVIPK